MSVKRFILGTHYEQSTGASSAVIAGDTVLVSGVYPMDDFGQPFADPDIYKQTVRTCQTLRKLCEQMHLGDPEYLRVQVFAVADATQVVALKRALFDFFSEKQPALSVCLVAGHIYRDVKVMLEATILV